MLDVPPCLVLLIGDGDIVGDITDGRVIGVNVLLHCLVLTTARVEGGGSHWQGGQGDVGQSLSVTHHSGLLLQGDPSSRCHRGGVD